MNNKVALMIVGSLRNYQKTADNLLTNLILPNNCDIFMMLSLNNYSENIRTVNNKSTMNDVKDYINIIGQSNRVKSYKILEECEDYNDIVSSLFEKNYEGYCLKKINYPKEEFKKNIETSYLNYMCWKLLQEYSDTNGTYDIIVRTRPDLLIKKEILLNCVDSNTFYHDRKSDYRNHPPSAYCSDYLCYGHASVMKVFSESVFKFGIIKKNYTDKHGINLSLTKEYQTALLLVKNKIILKPEMLSKKGEHMSHTFALILIR